MKNSEINLKSLGSELKNSRVGLRPLLELITFVSILVLGLSVLTLGKSGQEKLSYDSGKLTYTGTVRNHRMNGQGKLAYDDGDTYEGEFKNGVFHGQGKFVSSQGWTYVGEFKNGQPDGKGTLTAKDKTVYKGQFKQGIYKK